jgi:acyl CoA:acetate/3-ketoacid CoA transferase
MPWVKNTQIKYSKYASPFSQNTEEIGHNRLLSATHLSLWETDNNVNNKDKHLPQKLLCGLGGFILAIHQYKITKNKNKHIVNQIK